MIETEINKVLKSIKPDYWEQIQVRQNYPGSSHHSTESIFLRGPSIFDEYNYFNTIESVDFPLLKEIPIQNILNHLIEEFNIGYFSRCILVKLKPHSIVSPHIDEGFYAENTLRGHLCLSSNEKCFLIENGIKSHLKVGESKIFNHREIHSAENGGETDRIHFVFDFRFCK